MEVDSVEPEPGTPLEKTLTSMRERGVKLIYGNWLIEGAPRVILFDTGSMYHRSVPLLHAYLTAVLLVPPMASARGRGSRLPALARWPPRADRRLLALARPAAGWTSGRRTCGT